MLSCLLPSGLDLWSFAVIDFYHVAHKKHVQALFRIFYLISVPNNQPNRQGLQPTFPNPSLKYVAFYVFSKPYCVYKKIHIHVIIPDAMAFTFHIAKKSSR